MVFSAAGNLDHDRFVAAVEEKFSTLEGGEAPQELSAPEPSARINFAQQKSAGAGADLPGSSRA